MVRPAFDFSCLNDIHSLMLFRYAERTYADNRPETASFKGEKRN